MIGLAIGLRGLDPHRLSQLLAAPTEGKKPPTRRQRIGIDQLEQQLGASAPTGRFIPMGHVEGEPGDYLPDLDSKAFERVRAVARSGPSKFNGHTFSTATIIYGPHGLAPGVDEVSFYTSSHWMTTAVLHAGTDQPPQADGRRVFTHSWIGPGGRFSQEILRRVDYLIDHEDVMVVAGVNNNAPSEVPALLASAYNVIAVGLASGKSSGGYTVFEGPGRCKPDLVAPAGKTSFSTPMVAAVVARLLEAADRMGDVPNARRSEVIKAVLLAGAAKPPRWNPHNGHPLDEHLGAGVVRADRGYRILTAGPSAPGTVPCASGWGFESLTPDGTQQYEFDSDTTVKGLSAALVWNRRIDGRIVRDLLTDQLRWLDLPRLADFDLRLFSIDSQGQKVLVGESASGVDNVEHVYKKMLPPGRYVLEVMRKDTLGEDWDYALAWRVERASAASQ